MNRKMIVLVKYEWWTGFLVLPLGLLYFADALEKQGKNVKVIHETGVEKNINKLIKDLQEHESEIEWVGFSVMTGPALIPTIRASKAIKRQTNLKVVWGGMHPTVINENPDDLWYVDQFVRGEGETWVLEGLDFQLDDFEPAWHLIDYTQYEEFMMVTSRGCPFNCTFCYNSSEWRRKWKAHSVEKVFEIIEKYPGEKEELTFYDDYFFTDQKRGIAIVNRLEMPWTSTIRAHHLTENFVQKITHKPAGFQMGVESGNQRLLDFIDKGITIKQILNAIKVAYKYDINVFCTLIIDLPTETLVEKAITIAFARDIQAEYPNVRAKVKKYRPYPGTPLFQYALESDQSFPRTTEEWAEYYETFL